MISIYLDKQRKYVLRYFYLNKNIIIDRGNLYLRNISYINFKNEVEIFCVKNKIFKLMD